MAHRVGRGIALLFHDRGTRRRWVVSSTPRPHFTPGKDPVPILQEAGWAPGPVWTGGKSRPHRNSIPDRPARSSVAIPTELPGPLLQCKLNYIYASYLRINFLDNNVTVIELLSPPLSAFSGLLTFSQVRVARDTKMDYFRPSLIEDRLGNTVLSVWKPYEPFGNISTPNLISWRTGKMFRCPTRGVKMEHSVDVWNICLFCCSFYNASFLLTLFTVCDSNQRVYVLSCV